MHSEEKNIGYIPVAREDPGQLWKNGIESKKYECSKLRINMGDNVETTDRKFLYLAACAVNIASFVCGISLGWTSPTIPKLNGQKLDYISPIQPPITTSEESWIGSLLPLGAAVGPLAAGFFADKIGRKKTLLVSAVPFVVAYVMFAISTDVNYFFLGRFLCGLGVGGTFTVLPMYVAEISDDNVRGILATFFQLFIVTGLLFSYCVGPYVSITIFNIICAVLPCVFIVVFSIFIPESPYHLLAIKDDKGASETLAKFRARSEEDVQKELSAMRSSIEESMANKANFLDIFKSKGTLKALFISLSLVAFQQFSGVNVILFYTEYIFSATGSSIPADISAIIVGAVQVLGSFITPVLVERKGKRFLLIISGIGMAISEGVLGYYFYLKLGESDVSALFWLPIACLVLYIISYCLGFGPLPWAVMAELFPANVKSTASTMTASICWILGFVITKFFSSVTLVIGEANSFYIFAICCFIAAFYVYKLLPETTGKSFQEIQDILNGVAKSGEQTKL